MKNVQKWAVLVGVLILPFLIYYLIVYSAEENFFPAIVESVRATADRSNREVGTAWTTTSTSLQLFRIRTAKSFPAMT